MSKYDWLNKKYQRSIDQLRPWNENPRLNPDEKRVTIADFIEDLIFDEADKKSFLELLKSIAVEFVPADPIVVWQDTENQRYYVAEGNRRVLALKILREPNKAPKSIRGYVANLSKGWTPIDKLMVNVAPSFEEAEWYINQRNSTATLQRPWSRLQQQRWIESLYTKYGEDFDKIASKTSLPKSEIEAFVRNLKLIDLIKADEVKSALTEKEFISAASHKFPITILERFFSSAKVKESWGIEFDGVNIVLKNRAGFLSAYAQWIKNVVSDTPEIKIDTRTVTSDLDKILEALPKVDLTVDDSSVIESPAEPEDTGSYEAKSPKVSPKVITNDPNRKNLILSIYELENTDARLNGIFNELKRLSVKSYLNATAASIRIFLDLAVLDYIQSENLESDCQKKYKSSLRDITLSNRLTFLSETAKLKNTKAATIITKLTNKDNEFSLDVLNGYQHSKDTWSLSREFLNSFWDFLFPLFQTLLVIKENEAE